MFNNLASPVGFIVPLLAAEKFAALAFSLIDPHKENTMETGLNQVNNLFQHYGMPLIWNLLGAIAIWVIGGWIITAIRNFIKRTMAARNMDSTLASYVDTSVRACCSR